MKNSSQEAAAGVPLPPLVDGDSAEQLVTSAGEVMIPAPSGATISSGIKQPYIVLSAVQHGAPGEMRRYEPNERIELSAAEARPLLDMRVICLVLQSL